MPSRYLAPFLLILLLPACNMQSQPLPTPDAEGNVIITATPLLPTPNEEGMVVITATPNTNGTGAQTTSTPLPSSPTPAPTNTPIPDPSAALEEARQLVRQGYLEEAVQRYQAILAPGAALETAVVGEAAFGLGQAAVREGLFTEAVDALTLLITQVPNDPRLAQAYFLRGDAYLGLNQWQDAIADFQQYLALRPGLIDSYAYERIGDAQLALGQTEAALSSYSQALNANRSLIPMLILREKAAQIYGSLGMVDDAVAQYDAILAVARNAPYRASIDLAAAQALLNAGRTDEGIARAARVFDTYTETAAAHPAMLILLENGTSIDGYRRGLMFYNHGDYVAAVEAFNEFTSSYQLDAIPANLYLLLGRAYRQIGNSQAAIVAFQTIIDQYPNDPLLGAALLDRGRTYFLADEIAQAIDTYLNVANQYGTLPDAASEALWRAGYLYGTRMNDFVASRETFVRLANEYPNSEWALSGLQIAASNAVANGETSVAENLYGRIASITTGEDQAAALYWVGRLARQRGDVATSNSAFAQAQSAAPGSFFSARATDIIAGREAFQPPATLTFSFDEQAERQQAEEWLRNTFGIQQPGDLHTLSPELEADARMVRGRELWAVAAFDEAADEFDALLDESRENGLVLNSYQLAHFFRDIGAYYFSIVAGADVITAASIATQDAPPYIARFRYPAYYIDLVQAEAAKYGYDPLLMLSLIRQESLFDPNAVSVSNAKGLTQVIPSTAIYIAEQLGWSNFQDPDLFRPYVSIAFGAYYLDEQLRLFEGNRAAALAAYNAGPGYTLDWVRLSGGDVDALVTTITFDETRRYVRRIYSHYSLYRSLYGVE